MINDTDLDIQLYVGKEMGEGESLIYIRTDGVGEVYVVGGQIDDMVNAIVGIKDLEDVIMFAAAYFQKSEKHDINEYIKKL